MELGDWGHLSILIAFFSGIISLISFWKSSINEQEAQKWRGYAKSFYFLHLGGVFAIGIFLFNIIYFHKYEYNYAYAHSNNQLETKYMISSFWAGQEGSFLLWIFWNSIVGGILIFSAKKWVDSVMTVFMAIQVCLLSMIIGVVIPVLDFRFGSSPFILIAFFSGIISLISFWKSSINEQEAQKWRGYAKSFYFLHLGAVFAIGIFLFNIIYFHKYEYNYAYAHSNNELETKYMISSFWAGQEGSFLLWIFLNSIVGGILIFSAKKWVDSVMTIFMAIQVCLLSMIIGVVIPALDFRFGSSPFIKLVEMPDWAPFFKSQPGFIHDDGKGLSVLLQNYWMVIHPPTLFLGFSLAGVPFSFAVAGLWKNQLKEWVRPAKLWLLFGAAILSTGIMMGAYWAYETLSFGGYWNWDPVENAVFLPWIILVAALHGIVVFQRSQKGLYMTYLLVILGFLAIVYSTYLTRSGALTDQSVHSFTESGLGVQLTCFLAIFLIIPTVLLVIRWKEIPAKKEEVEVWTAEFWGFAGITVLTASALMVFLMLTIPVVFDVFPEKPEEIYAKSFLIFSIKLALFSGLAQLVWWKNVKQKLQKLDKITYFLMGVIFFIVSAYMVYIKNLDIRKHEHFMITDPDGLDFFLYYLENIGITLLITFSLFTIYINITVVIQTIKNKSLSGGALSHVGFGIMMIGIVFSSVWSNLLSGNGKISNDDNEVRKSTTLFHGSRVGIEKYAARYDGGSFQARDYNILIPKYDCIVVDGGNAVISGKDIKIKDKLVYELGDTIPVVQKKEVHHVTYFDKGEKFTLNSSIQMGMSGEPTASPDVKHFISHDLYTQVNSLPTDEEDPDTWSKSSFITMMPNEVYEDSIYKMKIIGRVVRYDSLKAKDRAIVGVQIEAYSKILQRTDTLIPLSILAKATHSIRDFSPELGLYLELRKINMEEGKFMFLKKQRKKSDMIFIKVHEKPLVNLVWIGTIITVLGMFMAMRQKNKNKKS